MYDLLHVTFKLGTTSAASDLHNKRNSNTILRNRTEGNWLSSPHSSCRSHLFQDTTDDSRSVSAWPVSQSHLSRLNIDHMRDQADKENKVETTTIYRLFGFDIVDCSRNSTAVDVTRVTTEVSSSTLSSTDTDRSSNVSKASLERKQEHQQVSQKETWSKQICRSRTKVLNIDCFFFFDKQG